jgi:hypothetical protein
MDYIRTFNDDPLRGASFDAHQRFSCHPSVYQQSPHQPSWLIARCCGV